MCGAARQTLSMGRRRTIALGMLVAALAAATPARAAGGPSGLLAPEAAGSVAAAGDVVAWSAYDPALGAYRLMLWRDGAAAPLAVAPSPGPFDVSAGHGPDGAVWLVWSRCAALRCDVVGYDLANPGERPIPAAATPAGNEHMPAIDGTRLAFVRDRGTTPQILVAGVSGAPKARVVAAALPTGVCDEGQRPLCQPTRRVVVDGIALHGDGLAVSARASSLAGGSEPGTCGLAGLRYVDLHTGLARRLTDAICGAAGAHITRPAFDARGRLWFLRACNSTRDACRGPGGSPQRYEPRTGTSWGTQAIADGSGLGVAATTGGLVLARWAPPRCVLPGDAACETITAVPGPSLRVPPTWSARTPDVPLATVERRGRLPVLRPASVVPCLVADPHPRLGADIWGGALVLPGQGGTFAVRMAGGHSAGRRLTPGASPSGRWQFAHVSLVGRAVCGGTALVTYRLHGEPATTFRVRVERAPS